MVMCDATGRTSAAEANALFLPQPCPHSVGFLLHSANRHKAGQSGIVPIRTVGNGTNLLSSMLSFVLVHKCSSELTASRGRGQKRRGIFSAGAETRTGAVKSGNTETRLSGPAERNVCDGSVEQRSWLAKQSCKGRFRAVMLESIKAKSATLTMDNL